MATLQDVILTLNRVPIIPVIQTEPVNYGKLPQHQPVNTKVR